MELNKAGQMLLQPKVVYETTQINEVKAMIQGYNTNRCRNTNYLYLLNQVVFEP